jgi:hypothetical protein
MLSRRTASAPAATAASTSGIVSASTSTRRRWCAAERAAATAGAIPPAARIPFSLIRIPSERENRWFVPPPTRTAYFSRTRSSGVVFRVSSSFVPWAAIREA